MQGDAKKNWVRTYCLHLLNANVFKEYCIRLCVCMCVGGVCACICVLIPDDKTQTVRCLCSLKHLSAP